jgi:hypothetical protein
MKIEYFYFCSRVEHIFYFILLHCAPELDGYYTGVCGVHTLYINNAYIVYSLCTVVVRAKHHRVATSQEIYKTGGNTK